MSSIHWKYSALKSRAEAHFHSQAPNSIELHSRERQVHAFGFPLFAKLLSQSDKKSFPRYTKIEVAIKQLLRFTERDKYSCLRLQKHFAVEKLFAEKQFPPCIGWGEVAAAHCLLVLGRV